MSNGIPHHLVGLVDSPQRWLEVRMVLIVRRFSVHSRTYLLVGSFTGSVVYKDISPWIVSFHILDYRDCEIQDETPSIVMTHLEYQIVQDLTSEHVDSKSFPIRLEQDLFQLFEIDPLLKSPEFLDSTV